MPGNEVWRATGPVQRAVPMGGLADAVHARVGGLVGDEAAQLHGAVAAATLGADPDLTISVIGVCGVQHFYLGKIGRGVLWLFTLGLFGVGLIIDVVTLPKQVNAVNARRAVGIK